MRLAFDRHGSGPGGPLVLLHGLSDNRRTYDALVGSLAEERTVLNADLRGHGESPHGDRYRAVDYAADVAELIEGELGRPAIIVGHSLGGLTASALAMSRPDLVTALFLEDPPLFEGDDAIRAASPAASFFPAFVAAIRAWQADGADRATVADALGAGPSPHGGTSAGRLGRERIERRAGGLLRFDPRAMDAAISGETWEGYDPMTTVRCPATVLRADPAVGAVFLPEHGTRLLEAVPHAEVLMIAGQAHGIHDDPEGSGPYREALERFLARLGADAR